MAPVLPRVAVLKSNLNDNYLVNAVLGSPGQLYLRSSGEHMGSHELAVFVLEISRVHKDMVHLRSSRNNKFLRRRANNEVWMVAENDRADDNLSSWTCTAFKVSQVGGDDDDGGNTFRLKHAQLGYLFPQNNNASDFRHLCLAALEKDEPGQKDVFTAIDIEPTMAMPRFVSFQSSYNHKYLKPIRINLPPYPEIQTFLQSSSTDYTSSSTMYEVVPSSSEKVKGMVHIRCSDNNKYWRNFATHNNFQHRWIVAEADVPNEDAYDHMTTLFRPVQVNDDAKTFRLRHVLLGDYLSVRTDVGSTSTRYLCLSAHTSNPLTPNQDVFTVTGWEPAMALPRFVAFKSNHNQKYLQQYMVDASFIRASAEDEADPSIKYEVVASKKEEGLVNIRCCQTNKYWRRKRQDDTWIVAEAHIPDEDVSNWTCTLFKPVQAVADAKTFRLRHVQLEQYVRLFDNDDNTNKYHLCLYAKEKEPAQHSLVDVFRALQMEELVQD